jgi:hypothetical protein
MVSLIFDMFTPKAPHGMWLQKRLEAIDVSVEYFVSKGPQSTAKNIGEREVKSMFSSAKYLCRHAKITTEISQKRFPFPVRLRADGNARMTSGRQFH